MTINENRYDRQIILPQWGEETQGKLTNSKVVVVGSGALGTNTTSALARAGVGKITVVDRDFVELSNLHRMSLLTEEDVGQPKAVAVKEKIVRINSDVSIEALSADLNPSTARELLDGHDLILDCTDNLSTRYLINDCSVKFNLPWIYAAVVGINGMTMNFVPGYGPCFRCLFPDKPSPGSLPTCDTVGVLNTIPILVSALQVTEALKILAGKEPAAGLVICDIWNRSFDRVEVDEVADCVCCQQKKFQFLNAELGETVTSLCGRNAVQINPLHPGKFDLCQLEKDLRPLGTVESGSGLLKFSTGDYDIHIFSDGRAIIKGTEDEDLARTLYARYVGV